MQLLSFILRMYIFLAISILWFCTLLLGTAAISRHVRIRQVPSGPQPTFAKHLFAAAKDQNSLTPANRWRVNETDPVARMHWNGGLKPISRNIRTQSISSKRP